MEADGILVEVEHLEALLAICHSNRRDLERREAQCTPLETPLELRSYLVELRDQIDQHEARWGVLGAESPVSAQRWSAYRTRYLAQEMEHIRELVPIYLQNVHTLEQRIAAHGPGQAPLIELRRRDAEHQSLTALQARLRRLEVEQAQLDSQAQSEPLPAASAIALQLTLVAPDGARYITEAPADMLISQFQTAFLETWSGPPAGAEPACRLRYTLHPAAGAPPYDTGLTLAEAGLASGATLVLQTERLAPASPIGLTVEDGAGNRYVTAVRLDTRIETLLRAFMETVALRGQPVVEVLSGAPGEPQRRLRPEATLYDECVGDGARLRIAAAA